MIIRIFFGMNLVYACNNAKYWAEKFCSANYFVYSVTVMYIYIGF